MRDAGACTHPPGAHRHARVAPLLKQARDTYAVLASILSMQEKEMCNSRCTVSASAHTSPRPGAMTRSSISGGQNTSSGLNSMITCESGRPLRLMQEVHHHLDSFVHADAPRQICDAVDFCWHAGVYHWQRHEW